MNQGGSYRRNPTTGERVLIERTRTQDDPEPASTSPDGDKSHPEDDEVSE